MIPRKFAELPSAQHLSPRILELDAEARDLFVRARAAVDEVDRLSDPALDAEAIRSDVVARGAAARAGKAASGVGAPAVEKLAQQRAAAAMEAEALLTAATQAEAAMRDEFDKLRTDRATSGYNAVKKAGTAYRKAIDTLATARADYLAARSVMDYIDHAAGEQYQALTDDLRLTQRGVTVARIPNSGERVSLILPIPTDRLLASTFALDLEGDKTLDTDPTKEI